MRVKHGLVAALVMLAGIAVSGTAFAQGVAPTVLPMQGYLTDGGGTPIDGSTDLTVNLYDGQLSSTVLYGEDQSVMVDAGSFTAYVGDGTPSAGALDLAIFRDNSDVWVGITIGTGTELPRFQLGSVPYAAFAQYSTNAAQLGGVDPSSYQNRVTGACGAGEAITAIAADGTVTCATVGDITDVTAGVGLVGGGATGGVTLNVNPAVVQSRVTGTCAAGESIISISATGTVGCASTGDITGVTAGTGLSGGGLSGNVTLNIANNGVGTAQIAANAVTANEIAAGAVGTSEIQADAVTSAQVADTTIDERDLNLQGVGMVSSTADQDILARYMDTINGVTTARVVIAVNGGTGRGAPGGGAGTMTVSCGATTLTQALAGPGGSPWTYITPSFACGASAFLLVRVRATAAASPVIIRHLEVLHGH